MKVFITLLLSLFLCFATAFGQEQKSNGFPFKNANIGIGFGIGQEFAVNLFATASFNNNFYSGFHYLSTSVHSSDVPVDYVRGIRLFTKSTRIPRDHFASHSLIVGKQFQKQQSAFSVSFETGLSWIIYNRALFSRKPVRMGFFGQEGDFDGYRTYNKTGLLLNGKLNYRVRSDINLELSTYGNINSIRSIIVGSLTVAFELFQKKKAKVQAKSK